jgi:eukaryotic-like serine/threonine-protein kinase
MSKRTGVARCPHCGALLPPDSPNGLCVQCLLQMGLHNPPSTQADAQTQVEPVDSDASRPDADSIPAVSNYRILRKLGEGGCGIVYHAMQLVPVRREVALKVIKLGMDTKAVIARFEAERQVLALMNHPNIAKIYDAGATSAGRPFFVMELVNGERITDHCDQRQLSVRERLTVFLQVCRAVQHAHQKGVIHRDLKPSNILVTEQEGVSVCKIIDFGIAKATSDLHLVDQTVFTAVEQFLGTPAYMSPEQAGLGRLDIDTRTDIYSIGVLLYELLTGRPPFDVEQLRRAALGEIMRIVCEVDPPRPSTRLTTLTRLQLTHVANNRHIFPTKLPILLRGDLDSIVMKTLEKEANIRPGL